MTPEVQQAQEHCPAGGAKAVRRGAQRGHGSSLRAMANTSSIVLPGVDGPATRKPRPGAGVTRRSPRAQAGHRRRQDENDRLPRHDRPRAQ
jgi:hypothetical protein